MNKEEKIIAIYAEVPDSGCKGLCWKSCGPIMLSNAERERLEEKYGVAPSHDGAFTCHCLDQTTHKCTIYEDRPLVCRLYGSVGGMKCPHGCKPTEGRISDKVAGKLIKRMHQI